MTVLNPKPYTLRPLGRKLCLNPKKGFTLIELMIVIAIIAIVFGIVITSANLVKRNSRDAKRQSDLRAIQSALEQYRADNIYYPATLPSGGSSFFYNGKTYLNSIPTDPTSSTSTPYVYRGLDSTGNLCSSSGKVCVNYCLFAALENPPSNPSLPTYSLCNATGVNPGGSYNLQVTQP